MLNIYTELGWLSRPDEEFESVISKIKSKKLLLDDISLINQYYLNISHSQIISNYLKNYKKKLKVLPQLEKFRLGVISNSNLEFLEPCLVSYALKSNIDLELEFAPFGQTINYLNNKNNKFYQNKCDAILISIDFKGFPMKANFVKNATEYIEDITNIINDKFKIPCIVQNIVQSEESLFGNLDFLKEDTNRNLIISFNESIKNSIINNDYNVLFDINGLANKIGLGVWYDPSLYNLTKTPFSKTVFPAYADAINKIIFAMRGKSRRLLIFDLDNTIWGGNIGDEGYDGIEIGRGSANGEAFLEIQKYFLKLRERGILLAVASKNNSKAALEAFKKNSEVLIKEYHLSSFEINWKDKAQNILKICNKLKLGAHSAVFVDDNSFERNLVRKILPQVAVPEISQEPSNIKRILNAANYFESVYFSQDDKIRPDFFLSETKRIDLKKHNKNVDDYLIRLGMQAAVSSFQKNDLKRLEQLVSKSNQFNLTTKRYNYQDLKAISNDKKFHTLQIRLSDVYGESGLIAIVILEKKNKEYIIDTWIQSCRILERKVENLILDIIIKYCKKTNIDDLIGIYIPTNKNNLVSEHYKKLNFQFLKKEKEKSLWKYSVKKYKKTKIPITLL